MPMFVKMGLGGTGFLGHQESHQRSTRKFAARRKVQPGFPIETPFTSIDQVNEYLGGDKIVCLICGRWLKSLGVHLERIHQVFPDQYRERYAIPWRHGLVCAASNSRYSEAVKTRMDDGYSIDLSVESIAKKRKLALSRRRVNPHSVEQAKKNLGASLGSIKHGTNGLVTKIKAAATPRIASPEHRARVSARFAGVPKSPEHRAKIAAALKARWEIKRAAPDKPGIGR